VDLGKKFVLERTNTPFWKYIKGNGISYVDDSTLLGIEGAFDSITRSHGAMKCDAMNVSSA
jgi:hypothetical protein